MTEGKRHVLKHVVQILWIVLVMGMVVGMLASRG